MLLLEPGQRVPDAGVEWGRWAEGLIRAELLGETDKAVEEEAASTRTPPKHLWITIFSLQTEDEMPFCSFKHCLFFFLNFRTAASAAASDLPALLIGTASSASTLEDQTESAASGRKPRLWSRLSHQAVNNPQPLNANVSVCPDAPH